MLMCYTIAVIMLTVGIGFYSGNAASCITGYRDMPDEEKRKINIMPLCKNLSVMFFLAAAVFGLAGYSELFRFGVFKWAMIGWIALCCADIAFINKSGRYVNQTREDAK